MRHSPRNRESDQFDSLSRLRHKEAPIDTANSGLDSALMVFKKLVYLKPTKFCGLPALASSLRKISSIALAATAVRVSDPPKDSSAHRAIRPEYTD